MGGTISSGGVAMSGFSKLGSTMLSMHEHIKQLERINAALAAEVDAQRPVVEAAQHWYNGGTDWSAKLATAVMTYETSHKDATHA